MDQEFRRLCLAEIESSVIQSTAVCTGKDLSWSVLDSLCFILEQANGYISELSGIKF